MLIFDGLCYTQEINDKTEDRHGHYDNFLLIDKERRTITIFSYGFFQMFQELA